jgi:hypothetical protein
MKEWESIESHVPWVVEGENAVACTSQYFFEVSPKKPPSGPDFR